MNIRSESFFADYKPVFFNQSPSTEETSGFLVAGDIIYEIL